SQLGHFFHAKGILHNSDSIQMSYTFGLHWEIEKVSGIGTRYESTRCAGGGLEWEFIIRTNLQDQLKFDFAIECRNPEEREWK
ncbi:hypothetical protein PFISCL1PPCAC_26293, partial [Pristionchus fissidentatus]